MSRFWLIAWVAAAGCGTDNHVAVQTRILTTEDATFDAGVVAVNDRYTLTIYLASTGQAPVTVFNVYTEDDTDTNWVVLDTWATGTSSVGGVEVPSLTIDSGSDDAPSYAPVEISFRPDAEGYFRETLDIESDDNELVDENPDNGNKIWKVVVRGVARYPCSHIYPTFHDFGERPAGGYFDTDFTIENCGTVTLTTAAGPPVGDAGFSIGSQFPIYTLPGSTSDLLVAWVPATGSAESADVTLVNNDPNNTDTISLIGNDCANSVDTSWDRDGDGWFSCGGDCDDTDANVNPEAADNKDDGKDNIDNDCDGAVDEGAGFSRDDDGDGIDENDGDCDDNDASVYPGAPEIIDQMDNDCNGIVDDNTDWYDDDGDGFSEREGDCDDTNAAIYPGASEAYDGVDNNCNGQVDEGTYSYDDDQDGYAEVQADGSEGDCDDANPWVYPGATEDCDGVDNDCDGLIDEGDDDVENGACAFLVQRGSLTDTTGGGSCATANGPTSALAGLALATALALSRRRRR